MKRFVLALVVLVFAKCGTEENAKLGDFSVFYRYYGSEFSHLPQQVLETSDGFVLLSNIQLPTTSPGVFKYKVKLIKTDVSGNVQWEGIYPSFADASKDDISLTAASMILTENGYVIIGDEINMASISAPEPSNLAMLTVDLSGAQVGDYAKILPEEYADDYDLPTDAGLHGKGITVNPAGGYIVMGSVSSNTQVTNNMLYAAMDASFGVSWIRFVGDGLTSFCSRVFLSQAGNVIWGGSSDDMRIFEYQQDNESSDLTRRDAPNNAEENAMDLCRVKGGLGGYAMIGTTTGGTTDDIYLVKFNQSGAQPVAFATQFPDFGGGDDIGVSVSSTGEGELIAAGSVASGNGNGYGATDILLTRVSTTGEILWSRNYGSSQIDEAASVIPVKDGGFLILGSTEFGTGFKKLTLIKTDRNGELNN